MFITELRLLAYFNKHATFPFLYCVEISDIPSLKTILPKLHADLLNCDVSTLKNFVIEKKNVNVDNLNTELEMKMLNLLCYSAAACIQRQCGREYGFPLNVTEERADDLTQISDEILKFGPTNNLY